MLPVCFASCSSWSLLSFHLGTRAISPVQKLFVKDKVFFRNRDCVHHHESSLRAHAGRVFYLPSGENFDHAGSIDYSMLHHCNIASGSENNLYFDPDKLGYLLERNGSYAVDNDISNLVSSMVSKQDIIFGDIRVGLSNENTFEIPIISNVDSQGPASFSKNDLLNLQSSLDQTSNIRVNQASLAFESSQALSENAASLSGSFGTSSKGISDLKSYLENIFTNIQEYLDNAHDTFNSSLNDNFGNVSQSIDNSITKLFYLSENAKQQTGSKLLVFSSDFKYNMYRAGIASVDILRQVTISLEDYLAKTSAFAVDLYASTKLFLPEEARNALNISEEKAAEIFKPAASAFQQFMVFTEMAERSFGLDPSDPIVPFIIFLCTSATIGVSYWVLRYNGYSGDLSPELTFELLKKEEGAVLVDIRPESLREAEGIPDLRRGTRIKYISATFPEVPNSTKKLLKNVNAIDDALLAVVICNFKMVQPNSKVIVMDSYGEKSKAIARSLRKYGMKKPYLVRGGFRSWAKNGLRIKQLKPETALTIFNEEAEAILDDIRPTPTSLIGYGLVFFVSVYSLLEWEKTLQLIGFVGLGQTIYKRFASYENSEDFKKDLRLLVAPIDLGVQAFFWAAGKLEPASVGLPTSPSSTAVQDRVLQAAAKHESQPSDADDVQPSDSLARSGDNPDLTKA